MSLAERRWLRLFTLCILYVAQGIPFGFMATTVPSYLADQGVSPATIGVALTTTTLPYSLKWVWGPIVDAFSIARFGRRRPWIILAQLMMGGTMLALVAVPDLTADLKLLVWMFLLHTVFNSLQDVAVDALAVDLLDEEERGRANGLMYASKYAGTFVGGAGMATVVYHYGLDAALVTQAAILFAIMLVPLLVRERPADAPDGRLPGARAHRGTEPRPSLVVVLNGLADVFATRAALVTALLMLGISFANGVLAASGFVLFTQQLGWSALEYSRLTGGVGVLAGLGGAVLGGFLADLVGHRRLAAIASLALAVTWAVFALVEPAWSNDTLVYVLALAQAVLLGLLVVTLFAMCMDVCAPAVAASQFTIYMALMNFSTTLGYRFTAQVTDWVDFQTAYFLAAAFQVVVTSLLRWNRPGPVPAERPAPVVRRRRIVVMVSMFGVMIALTTYVVSGMV